jgi:HEAT repeat protein
MCCPASRRWCRRARRCPAPTERNRDERFPDVTADVTADVTPNAILDTEETKIMPSTRKTTRRRTLVAAAMGVVALAGTARAQEPAGVAAPADVSQRFTARAPEPWLQEDPAAKAYQSARDALNAGRYGEAAKAFEALRADYPKSGYVPDSYYWQAFALYRQGGRGELRTALDVLQQQGSRYPKADTHDDAEGLRVRVEGQLARLGDANAAAAVAQQTKDPCQGDDQAVRQAALSALMNMSSEQAVPILQDVLKSRGACSAELRRQAVFLVAQKMDDKSVDILLDLAERNPDPDPKVREAAVFWLSQVHTDQAVDALDSILKQNKDPELQERAVFALSQQGSERSVKILRDYASRADAPEKLRETAIFWIGQNSNAGGATYLMDLYPKLQNDTLKEKVIFGVGQSGTKESRAWLLARAKDRSESVDLRKNALFWAGQSGGLTAADLGDLYGGLSDREMKKQVIFVASQSPDSDAVDFLMNVAKTEKDAELRKSAIFWLGQSKDPRVAQFLLDLIKG